MSKTLKPPEGISEEQFGKALQAWRQELINRSRETVELPEATFLLEIALKERAFKTKWKDDNILLVQNLTPRNKKRLEEFLEDFKKEV